MKKTVCLLLLTCIFTASCTNSGNQAAIAELERLQIANDSLKSLVDQGQADNSKIYTFFTFQKEDAEEAMNLYLDLFDNSKIIEIKRWGAEGPGKEGTIMHATFELNGQSYMCSDSPAIHAWDFSPAVSNFVQCKSESELVELFDKLGEGGEVMMPVDNYGFSKKFGWVADRFGISWQLNLD